MVANCFTLAPFVRLFSFLRWACASFSFIGDVMFAFVFILEVGYREDSHLYFANEAHKTEGVEIEGGDVTLGARL